MLAILGKIIAVFGMDSLWLNLHNNFKLNYESLNKELLLKKFCAMIHYCRNVSDLKKWKNSTSKAFNQ